MSHILRRCCALLHSCAFLSVVLRQICPSSATLQHPHLPRKEPLLPDEGPLKLWREDRFVRCIFCMNYDDYNNLSTFGCEQRRVATCTGNICYMRQHKRPEYFLYTSGCLNLTRHQLHSVRMHIGTQSGNRGQEDNGASNWGNETQLCEVGSTVNTCICSNRSRCNNVTSVEPFIEYAEAIFANVDFDELAHFRHILPDDPILEEFERERASGESYFLVRAHSPRSAVPAPVMCLLCSLLTLLLLLFTPEMSSPRTQMPF